MSAALHSFSLDTFAGARAGIEHFNAFHDGFVRRIEIVSADEFVDRDTQRCSGCLDLTIRFAHWNYDFAAGARPHHQEVEATFHHVRDLAMGVTGAATDWSILRMAIAEAEALTTHDGGDEAARLRVELWQHRFVDSAWQEHSDLVFTCSGGLLRELSMDATS